MNTKKTAIECVKKYGFDKAYNVALSNAENDFKWYGVVVQMSQLSPRDIGDNHLSDKWLIPPFSVINTHRGKYKNLASKWRDKYNLGTIVTGRNENLIGTKTNIDGAKTVGTSIFNPVIAEVVYTWFMNNDGIVFDPFCGGPERGIVASALNKRYIGIDIRNEQIEANYEHLRTYGDFCTSPKWINADATFYDFPKSDLILTCPPYYNLEVYSSKDGDLSNQCSYSKFLDLYKNIIKKCCNSCNGYICFVVGNVRENKNFIIDLPGDTIRFFDENGFGMHNEIIIYAVGSAMVRTNFANRKVTNVHQKLLIFKKR